MTFLAVIVLVMAWLFLRTGKPDSHEATLRQTASGAVMGYEDESNTYAWKGIPFAKPPVGELRWRAPQPPERWEGVKETLEYASSCVQMIGFDWLPVKPVIGSEDCLYLDVWTPRLSNAELATAKLPVMVFIHGGANTLGMSGAIRHHRLAGKEDVIVVAIQYRLGLLGWLSHPALRSQAQTDLDASSNFALLDMIAALTWVQNNIASFGGNPDNVTIFGQSAGGFNVYALLGSPVAKGLFHRAIAQSGNIQTLPRALAENYSDDEQPGLPYSSREYINRLLMSDERASDRREARALQDSLTDEALMEYLRGKSHKALFKAVMPRGLLGYSTYSNVRDGIVLPDMPLLELFTDPQRYNAVPLIAGSNKDEYKTFLWSKERFSESHSGLLTQFSSRFYPRLKDVDEYNRISSYFSQQWEVTGVNEPAAVLSQSQPGKFFGYRLDWARQKQAKNADMSELFGSAHGIDTVFLAGPEAVSGVSAFAQAEDEADYDNLGDIMRGYWAEFARTGVPGRGGDRRLPEWQAWRADGQTKLLFDLPPDSIRMSSDTFLVPDLKARLLKDPAIKSVRERCELYAQLFWYALTKDFFDAEEYRSMGCEQYPLESFEAII